MATMSQFFIHVCQFSRIVFTIVLSKLHVKKLLNSRNKEGCGNQELTELTKLLSVCFSFMSISQNVDKRIPR